MTAATVWRRARLVVVVAVLLSTVWGGFSDGVENLRGITTAWQRVAAIAELLYGVAAIAAIWALVERMSWLRIALVVWIAGTTITAGLAPVVWGDANWSAGVASGASAAVATVLIAWGAIAHQRTSLGPS